MTCEGDERRFPLWGPCSGGGESIVVRNARVFVVGYGDASSLPGGAEELREYAVAEFVRSYGADPRAAPAIELLRERGHHTDTDAAGP